MGIFETDGVSTAPNAPALGKGRLYYDAVVKAWLNIDDDGVITTLGAGNLIVPVADIDDPVELNAITGATGGAFLTAIQAAGSADDALTVYAWDVSPAGAENVPFTVDGGGGGQWRAFTGKYTDQALTSSAATNILRSFYPTFLSMPDPADVHGLLAHVHSPSDPLLGEAFYGAHSDQYQMLKDFHNDDKVALTPAAVVDIDFGQQAKTYQTLTLDQNTTLTVSNGFAGKERILVVQSGAPGQTLTLPASVTVVQGAYDTSGAENMVIMVGVAPTQEQVATEAQGGGAAPAEEFWAQIVPQSAVPAPHATSHENGGSDEINVAGLSGVLADDQTPAAHALGGAAHSADTLANLNAKISDATLDDSSASRTPSGSAGGDVGGTYPSSLTVTDLTISSEAQGDILYRNATNWVRLAPGTSGQVLQTNGAAADPSWVNAAAGSSFLIDENWLSGNFDTDECGQYGWEVVRGGTGNALNFIADVNRQGIWDAELGTAAAGRVATFLGGVALINPFKVDGSQNTQTAEFVVRFTGSIASADIERATFGWGDGFELAGGVEHSNGVYVEFDPTVSSTFAAVNVNGGTRSKVNGTTTVVIDTWYRVAMVMTYPGGVPTSQLFVNGLSEGASSASNTPTIDLGFGQRGDCGATVGTEAHVQVSRTRLEQTQDLED